MVDRYVDGTLSGTTATYNPATRESVGGSDAGYQTMLAAFAALQATGDTIYMRSGTYAESNLFATERFTLTNYNNETVTLGAVADLNIIRLSSSGANGCDIGGFTIATGTGSTTKRVINPEGTITSFTIRDITDEGNLGAIISAPAGVTIDAYNIHVKGGAYRKFQAAGAGATLNVYMPKIIDSGTTNVSVFYASAGTINVYQPLILGADEIAETASGATINFYNPIIAGCGKDSYTGVTFTNAGAITVNGGVVNANVHRMDIVESGNAVTWNNVTQEGVIKFADGFNDAIMCLVMLDSGHVAQATRTIDIYQAGADAAGGKLTLITDDQNPDQIVPYSDNDKAALASFVAAGHELACEGNGSSRLIGTADHEDEYYEVAYSGAESNPTWTVSGTTLTLTTTEGGEDLSIDISSGSASRFMASGASSVFSLINASTNWDIRYLDGMVGASPDDLMSYCLAQGSTPLTGGGTWDAVAIDRTGLFFNEEIVNAKTYAEALVPGVTVKTYGYPIQIYDSAAATAAESAGYICAFGGGSASGNAGAETIESGEVIQSINGLNRWNIGITTKDTIWNQYIRRVANQAAWDLLDASTQESRIRTWARTWASGAMFYGWFGSVVLPLSTPLDSNEVEWVMDELQTCGVRCYSISQAVEYLDSNYGIANDTWTATVDTDTSGIPSSDSDAVEAGKKWWTGAEPVGLDGEPFSDLQADAGAVQSTLGSLHPVNL